VTFTFEEHHAGGTLRFASPEYVFVRFQGRWEFYRVQSTGPCRGLEMFAGYVEAPAQVVVLERAAQVAQAQRLPA